MRKEVKPAVKCKCCGQTTEYPITEEFCDQCGQKLPENMYSLHMTVFVGSINSETKAIHCCSWKCVRAYLVKNQKKLQKIDFISLPYPTGKLNNKKENKQYCDLIENFYKDFLLVEAKQKSCDAAFEQDDKVRDSIAAGCFADKETKEPEQ